MKNFLLFCALFLSAFAQPANGQSQPAEASQSLRPTITYKEKAKYTQAALDAGIHGTVLISAVFQADGKITRIIPIRGLPHGLTEMAVEAAQQIRFKPALKENQPVSVRMSMEFAFALGYRDKRHLKRMIVFAFPYLLNETVEKLAQVFDKHKPDSYTADLWLVACDKRGAKTLAKTEQSDYSKMQNDALQLLAPERQKSVQRLREKEQDDKLEDDDLYALNRLIFEGIALSPQEKQTRYIELHNRVVLAGLERFQAK